MANVHLHARKARRREEARVDTAAGSAVEHWPRTDGVFAARSLQEPSDREIGYVQFGRAIFRRALPEFACRLGKMVEESCATHAALRKACGKHIGAHSSVGKADIERYVCGVKGRVPPIAMSLVRRAQAVLGGALVFAKPHGVAKRFERLRRCDPCKITDRFEQQER